MVEQLSPKIYSLCLQYMADEDTAQDMVQETFIKVYKSIEQYNQEAQLDTWVYRIAINTCKEELRKRKTKKNSPNFGNLAKSDEEDAYWKDTLPVMNYVEKEILDQEKTEALYQSIYQLTDDQQSAFVLYYLDEHSITEVADIMGKTPGATEALLHRARTKMKELLAEYHKK